MALPRQFPGLSAATTPLFLLSTAQLLSVRYPFHAFITRSLPAPFSVAAIWSLSSLSTLSHFLGHLPKSTLTENRATSFFRCSLLSSYRPSCPNATQRPSPQKPTSRLPDLRPHHPPTSFSAGPDFPTSSFFQRSSNFARPVFFTPGHFPLTPVFPPPPFPASPKFCPTAFFRSPSFSRLLRFASPVAFGCSRIFCSHAVFAIR